MEQIDADTLTDEERERRIREIDAELRIVGKKLKRIEDAEERMFREFETAGQFSMLVIMQKRLESTFPSVRKGWSEDVLNYAYEQAAKHADAGVPGLVADALACLDARAKFFPPPTCGGCAHFRQLHKGVCTRFDVLTEPDTDAADCPEFQYPSTE